MPVSGWRSQAEQQAIWEDTLQRRGEAFTRQYVAVPGCSEHQTGLAIDLGRAAREIDFIRPDFPEEGACGRFRRLAPRYGFIQRYHREKESLTGIACEPWHYRYVGTPHALLMEREGLCLEEYLDWVQTAPRTCRLEHGRSARVFYMPCAGDETELRLPEGCCQVSGRQPERICRDSLGGVGMADGRRGAALDLFRLAAVVLVVANHTSPLVSVSPLWDFWFTRVLARVAVPFFLMVSGYFLAKDQWRRTGVFLKKTCLLYGAAVLLYLPLNWYNGGYGPAEWVKKLLLDGTFYHLWYFPGVILGVLVARGLLRLGSRTALTAAGLLYLVGLGGDSYYGLTCQLPALEALYGEIFQIFAYTRNGLFFTPLFLLLGAAGVRWSVRTSAAGLCAAFAAMTAEGLWLHGLQVQRHDSMYMLLPLVMVCLFSLLLGLNRGERRSCRKLSSLIYVLHPWCIVLVRGGAEVLGLEGPLVENSMGHFLAVLASSAAASWALWLAWSRRPLKRSNKG